MNSVMPITILHALPTEMPLQVATEPLPRLGDIAADNEIPVKLCWMDDAIQLEVEDAPSFLIHPMADVGSLYICTKLDFYFIYYFISYAFSQIVWFNPLAQWGFAVDYRSISLYGVGKRLNHSFVHIQLDLKTYLTADGEEVQVQWSHVNGNPAEDDAEEHVTELRLVPRSTEAGRHFALTIHVIRFNSGRIVHETGSMLLSAP